MDKKDRGFLYKLESYTKDLATYKYQNKSYKLENNYNYKYIEDVLNNCSEVVRWLLKDHLKVVWKIATLEAEISTLYYGDFLKRNKLKEKIEHLEKECLVIKDISERSFIEDQEKPINIEIVKKGYEYLRETLKQQEEWLERNPTKSTEFRDEIKNTRKRVENLEEFIGRAYEEKEKRD